MADPEITQRLDTIISILKLTNRNALAGARNELDDVAKALIRDGRARCHRRSQEKRGERDGSVGQNGPATD
jgi:hypothetical protein